MNKESFLESLRKGKTSTAVLSEEPAPVPVAEVPIPKPAVAETQPDVRINWSDERVDKALKIAEAMQKELMASAEGLSPMQIVAVITRASKSLEEAVEAFNDDASKEFEIRMAADPTATKVVVGGAEWTRNQDRVNWTYSPAVKALQEKEKADGIATSKIAHAKKAFKITILKD